MDTLRSKKKQQAGKSSTKKIPVKGLRNVLAQPYTTQWPTLNDDQGSRLEELLNRLLPELRRDSQRIPWSQLRKMSKDERRTAKEELLKNFEKIQHDNSRLKAIVLGVNAVTRNLEKDKLCSVLLDSGVESLLIKHVILMAQNNDVPVLLIPFLKKVTLRDMGFASAAMGFKHEAKDSEHFFHEVYQEIVKFGRIVQPMRKIVDDTSSIEKMDVATMRVEKKDSRMTNNLSTNIYKYRSTRNDRIFVPPISLEKPTENIEKWGDFIAIGNDDANADATEFSTVRKQRRYMDLCETPVEEMKQQHVDSNENEENLKKKNGTYLSLKVKRIQGNNNRVKATKLGKSKKKILNKK